MESIMEEVLRAGEKEMAFQVLAQLRREHLEKAKHPPRKKRWSQKLVQTKKESGSHTKKK